MNEQSDFPQSTPTRPGPLYRYGMFVFYLVMLVAVFRLSQSPYSSPVQRNFGFGIVFGLLLNHLAFAFHWPRRIFTTLVIAALVWGICVACYTAFVLYSAWAR